MTRWNVLLGAVLLGVLACNKTDTKASGEEAPATTTPTETQETPPATGGEMGDTEMPKDDGTAGTMGDHGTMPGMGGQGDMPVVTPSQGQIVHIIETVNQAEIDEAQLADGKVQNPEVKAYAERMIREHTAANERLNTLANQIEGLNVEDNALSNQLKEEHKAAMDALRTLDGPAFEQAYIARQVRAHAQALDTIDRMIAPNLQDEQLKAYVGELRGTIADHHQQAEQLQEQLRATETSTL